MGTLYGRGNDRANLFSRLDEMGVGYVGVARRGAVAAVPEQLAHEGQVLARHDRLAGRRVAQIVQAEPIERLLRCSDFQRLGLPG